MSNVFDYAPIRATAIGLIKQFGLQLGMKLLKPTQAAPTDPAKPWRVGEGTMQEFPFVGVYIPAKLAVRLGAPAADASTCVVMIPGDIGAEPIARKDRLQILATIAEQVNPIYSVSEVERLAPDGTAIFYKVACHAYPLETPEGSTEL